MTAATRNEDDALTTALRTRVAELLTLSESLRVERDHAAAERDQAVAARAQADKQAKLLEQRADKLALQVKRLAYLLYGRRSEKLSAEEMGQLVLSLGGSEQDAQNADPNVPAPAPLEESLVEDETANDVEHAGKRKRRKHSGRTALSPLIERVITEVLVPEAERRCKCCSHMMTSITPRDHECVEHVPEKLIVHVERREVLVCKNSACRGDAVTAERVRAPVVVRRAGNSLLASLIENKCDDALPIHRQRDRLMRLGFDVPLSTLYDYWTHGTDLLNPVAATTLSSLLGDDYVNIDDTKLKVLDATHKKGRYLGHLWCFTSTRPLVAYTFTKSWSAADIAPFLCAIDGFIQCDDYKGYSTKIPDPGGPPRMLVPPERRLGCMMHVRRRFHDALKLGNTRAALPLSFIREIYAVEAEAKTLALDAAARLQLRTHKSLPWLERLDAWVDENARTLLPTSKLGEACGYAIAQRPFIRRCFTDGRFEIDNGKVERAIREPAIGRRNYHFTGSADAAQRLASAYTLVQSCRALGINTRGYLIDVLDKLESGWPLRRIAELVPDRWAADRGLLTTSSQPAQ